MISMELEKPSLKLIQGEGTDQSDPGKLKPPRGISKDLLSNGTRHVYQTCMACLMDDHGYCNHGQVFRNARDGKGELMAPYVIMCECEHAYHIHPSNL